MTDPIPGPVEDLIPHRPPFVMLSEVLSYSADRATGRHVFSGTSYGVVGGVVTPALLIECLAQLSAAWRRLGVREHGGTPATGMLVKINEFEWLRPVQAGDLLDLVVRVESALGPMVLFSGEVSCGEAAVARGRFCVIVKSRDEAPA